MNDNDLARMIVLQDENKILRLALQDAREALREIAAIKPDVRPTNEADNYYRAQKAVSIARDALVEGARRPWTEGCEIQRDCEEAKNLRDAGARAVFDKIAKIDND